MENCIGFTKCNIALIAKKKNFYSIWIKAIPNTPDVMNSSHFDLYFLHDQRYLIFFPGHSSAVIAEGSMKK